MKVDKLFMKFQKCIYKLKMQMPESYNFHRSKNAGYLLFASCTRTNQSLQNIAKHLNPVFLSRYCKQSWCL